MDEEYYNMKANPIQHSDKPLHVHPDGTRVWCCPHCKEKNKEKKVMTENIQTRDVVLPSGNTIRLFVNTKTNLIVLDIIDPDMVGGNEFYRKEIDEMEMMDHLNLGFTAPVPGSSCLIGYDSLGKFRLRAGLKYALPMLENGMEVPP